MPETDSRRPDTELAHSGLPDKLGDAETGLGAGAKDSLPGAHTVFSLMCTPTAWAVIESVASSSSAEKFDPAMVFVAEKQVPAAEVMETISTLRQAGLIDDGAEAGSWSINRDGFVRQLELLNDLQYSPGPDAVAGPRDAELTPDNIDRYAVLGDPQLWSLLLKPAAGQRDGLRGDAQLMMRAHESGLTQRARIIPGVLAPLEAGLRRHAGLPPDSPRPGPAAGQLLVGHGIKAAVLRMPHISAAEQDRVAEIASKSRILTPGEVASIAGSPAVPTLGKVATNVKFRSEFLRLITEPDQRPATVLTRTTPVRHTARTVTARLSEHVAALQSILSLFPSKNGEFLTDTGTLELSEDGLTALAAVIGRPSRLHAALLITRAENRTEKYSRVTVANWSVASLADRAGIKAPTMTAQINLMRDAGVVEFSGGEWRFVDGSLDSAKTWAWQLAASIQRGAGPGRRPAGAAGG